MTLKDFYAIIQEIWQDDLESRYVTTGVTWSSFSAAEQQNMIQFVRDYYHKFLQGNDTVTQLSNTDFFKFLTFTFDQRGKQTLTPSKDPTNVFLNTQKY